MNCLFITARGRKSEKQGRVHLVMCLLDKVTKQFGPPLPPSPPSPKGGKGGKITLLLYNIVVIFGFDCGTNLLVTFGKFSFSLPVTVSTSTYVTGGSLFSKMFSPGPSKQKGW